MKYILIRRKRDYTQSVLRQADSIVEEIMDYVDNPKAMLAHDSSALVADDYSKFPTLSKDDCNLFIEVESSLDTIVPKEERLKNISLVRLVQPGEHYMRGVTIATVINRIQRDDAYELSVALVNCGVLKERLQATTPLTRITRDMGDRISKQSHKLQISKDLGQFNLFAIDCTRPLKEIISEIDEYKKKNKFMFHDDDPYKKMVFFPINYDDKSKMKITLAQIEALAKEKNAMYIEDLMTRDGAYIFDKLLDEFLSPNNKLHEEKLKEHEEKLKEHEEKLKEHEEELKEHEEELKEHEEELKEMEPSQTTKDLKALTDVISDYEDVWKVQGEALFGKKTPDSIIEYKKILEDSTSSPKEKWDKIVNIASQKLTEYKKDKKDRSAFLIKLHKAVIDKKNPDLQLRAMMNVLAVESISMRSGKGKR